MLTNSQSLNCHKYPKECRELIANSTSVFNTVYLLLRRLFTEEEIMSHSVSGRASSSKAVAKPRFNTAKLDLLKSLVIELHKEITASQITCEIQAVQKSLKTKPVSMLTLFNER